MGNKAVGDLKKRWEKAGKPGEFMDTDSSEFMSWLKTEQGEYDSSQRTSKDIEKARRKGELLDEGVGRGVDPARGYYNSRSYRRGDQMSEAFNQSSAMHNRGNEMLAALRDSGPSLAVMAGNRQKREALQQVAEQEARSRGGNSALAALLGSRNYARVAGGAGENIASARGAEVSGLTNARGGGLRQARGNAMGMFGAYDDASRALGNMSSDYASQLRDEALVRRLANMRGANSVEMARLGRVERPGGPEMALGALGGSVPYFAQAFGGNQAPSYDPNAAWNRYPQVDRDYDLG